MDSLKSQSDWRGGLVVCHGRQEKEVFWGKGNHEWRDVINTKIKMNNWKLFWYLIYIVGNWIINLWFSNWIPISIMTNNTSKDFNSSESPMNCTYFIDWIKWHCQIIKSSRNSNMVSAYHASTKVIITLYEGTWKKNCSFWSTEWF